MFDNQLIQLLKDLPADSVLIAVILSVILAPIVYRFRLKLNRWLRRFFWFSLGWISAIIFIL
jgi:hypothetical protein